ncbi:MAG: hypothetical protein V1686_02085 [Patescibacteria group bacterium]
MDYIIAKEENDMKALWLKSFDSFEPYDPKIHLAEAIRFIYWKEAENQEEIIMIGWPEEFREKQFTCNLCHQNLAIPGIAPKRKPDGVGNLMDGQIISWMSGGYIMDTPWRLHSRIMELLGVSSPTP